MEATVIAVQKQLCNNFRILAVNTKTFFNSEAYQISNIIKGEIHKTLIHFLGFWGMAIEKHVRFNQTKEN